MAPMLERYGCSYFILDVLMPRHVHQRTSGDSKAKVYKRIAGQMGLDTKGGHARVKRKLDECVPLTYKTDRSS